jgi:hypothetical protein
MGDGDQIEQENEFQGNHQEKDLALRGLSYVESEFRLSLFDSLQWYA